MRRTAAGGHYLPRGRFEGRHAPGINATDIWQIRNLAHHVCWMVVARRLVAIRDSKPRPPPTPGRYLCFGRYPHSADGKRVLSRRGPSFIAFRPIANIRTHLADCSAPETQGDSRRWVKVHRRGELFAIWQPNSVINVGKVLASGTSTGVRRSKLRDFCATAQPSMPPHSAVPLHQPRDGSTATSCSTPAETEKKPPTARPSEAALDRPSPHITRQARHTSQVATD